MATRRKSHTRKSNPDLGIETYSLGEFESRVMNVVWDLEPPITTRQVFDRMQSESEGEKITYSTVTLTMAKLAQKGLLLQKRVSPKRTHPFVYVPLIGRRQMGLLMLDHVARKVLGKPFREALIDLLPECSKEEIARLKQALS